MPPLKIGLIGDYNASIPAHVAIPRALALAGAGANATIEPVWMPTALIAKQGVSTLAGCHGLWCVPGSPYASMEGALIAIRFARENNVPFLGTCGGFQHALIEHARNVLGWEDADHEESSPGAPNPVISKLSCSLAEKPGRVLVEKGSFLEKACGSGEMAVAYNCNYGMNPALREKLGAGGMRFSAWDAEGAPRAFERTQHPFFVGTLFQPERAALNGVSHPIIEAFVRAAAEKWRSSESS